MRRQRQLLGWWCVWPRRPHASVAGWGEGLARQCHALGLLLDLPVGLHHHAGRPAASLGRRGAGGALRGDGWAWGWAWGGRVHAASTRCTAARCGVCGGQQEQQRGATACAGRSTAMPARPAPPLTMLPPRSDVEACMVEVCWGLGAGGCGACAGGCLLMPRRHAAASSAFPTPWGTPAYHRCSASSPGHPQPARPAHPRAVRARTHAPTAALGHPSTHAGHAHTPTAKPCTRAHRARSNWPARRGRARARDGSGARGARCVRGPRAGKGCMACAHARGRCCPRARMPASGRGGRSRAAAAQPLELPRHHALSCPCARVLRWATHQPACHCALHVHARMLCTHAPTRTHAHARLVRPTRPRTKRRLQLLGAAR